MDRGKGSVFFKSGSVGEIHLLNTASNTIVIKSIDFNNINFLGIVNELRSLIKLKHRFIVKFFGHELVRHKNCQKINIKLEYCGIPLSEYLIKRNLSIIEKEELKLKIKEVIDYIHSQGYFHGDLSSNNVLINGNGDPKLIDFCNCMSISDKQILNPTIDVADPLGRYEGVESDLFALEVLNYLIDNGSLPTASIKSGIKLKKNLSLSRLGKYSSTDRCEIIFDEVDLINPTRETLIGIELKSSLKKKGIDIKFEYCRFVSQAILGKNSEISLGRCLLILEKNGFDYVSIFSCFTETMCRSYLNCLTIECTRKKSVYFLTMLLMIIEKVNNKNFNFDVYLRNIINSDFSVGQFYSTLNRLKHHDDFKKMMEDSCFTNPVDLHRVLISK